MAGKKFDGSDCGSGVQAKHRVQLWELVSFQYLCSWATAIRRYKCIGPREVQLGALCSSVRVNLCNLCGGESLAQRSILKTGHHSALAGLHKWLGRAYRGNVRSAVGESRQDCGQDVSVLFSQLRLGQGHQLFKPAHADKLDDILASLCSLAKDSG